MTLQVDPEGREVRALRRAGPWRGRRVLEIGCGDGRLTRRLVRLGAIVLGIDPTVKKIRAARRRRPRVDPGRVVFRVGHAERLREPDESFDRVVFAWAL